MKKLLTLLGSISMIGTAGATVVACGDTKTAEETPTVSKQKLLDLIEQASNLKGVNPNEEAEAQLKLAITNAQTVADNDQATQAQVDEATQALQQEIDDFVEATKTDFTILSETIKQATELKANPKNPNETEEAVLGVAIDEAQKVADNAAATQIEVNAAVDKLKEAMELFNKNTATDFSDLEAAIADAEASIQNPPNENANVDKLQAEINKAKEVLANQEATQEEVDGTTAVLIAATAEFESTLE